MGYWMNRVTGNGLTNISQGSAASAPLKTPDGVYLSFQIAATNYLPAGISAVTAFYVLEPLYDPNQFVYHALWVYNAGSFAGPALNISGSSPVEVSFTSTSVRALIPLAPTLSTVMMVDDGTTQIGYTNGIASGTNTGAAAYSPLSLGVDNIGDYSSVRIREMSIWTNKLTGSDAATLNQYAQGAYNLTNTVLSSSSYDFTPICSQSPYLWMDVNRVWSVTDGAAPGTGWHSVGLSGICASKTGTSPIWRSSAGPNGQAVWIMGSGGADTVFYNPITTQNQPLWHFVVAQQTNTDISNPACLFDGTGVRNQVLFNFGVANGHIRMYAGNTMDAGPFTSTNWTIFAFRFNGASSQMRTNGVLAATGNAGTSGQAAIQLGHANGGGFVLGGRLGDYLMFPGGVDLSSNDVYLVEHALSRKFAISIP